MTYPHKTIEISAYKHPVEDQNMKKVLDKIITGFFVVTLGIAWYCSTMYHVKPEKYRIIIKDEYGKQIKNNEIRTDFQTLAMAQSYVLEYQKRFPLFELYITNEIPKFKKRFLKFLAYK